MAKKKQKYYVVWQGNNPGIYDNWTSCQQQINGYPNAMYKSFKSRAEAEAAFHGNVSEHVDFSGRGAKPKKVVSEAARQNIVWDSISVDAACSGNPGVMEYQGVDTQTEAQLFHQKFPLGTNNIGEFLAIVHALAMFKQQGKDTPIYTDSRIAMGWVKKGKAKTTLPRIPKTKLLYQVIDRAEKWLAANTWNNPLMKWETKSWGEIPADFGRK